MMQPEAPEPSVRAGRLDAGTLAERFGDLHPPLDDHQAAVAADRCYFCHDAPCVTACPTEIDIPLFIREIQSGVPEAAALTILSQNILGGMCARVCPTETLCEEACVRNAAEGEPVKIGLLQRYATDRLMSRNAHPFERAPQTGRRVAVVGAGPAGLACAHRLAMRGHDVDLFDARPRAGGLNEYGIAAYKTVDNFAQAEIDWLMGIGGITLHLGRRLGEDLSLEDLRRDYDAVFLGLGLQGVNALELGQADAPLVEDAVDFIARLRQSPDKTDIAVGDRVVVIGGGMTAIDAAVQARLLGAEDVTIAYRRGRTQMKASDFEQELALRKGVKIATHLQPEAITPGGLVCRRTDDGGGEVTLPCDHVLVAIGQRLAGQPEALRLEGGKIAVTGAGRTSLPGVWAGGDCTPGEDLTVVAVAEGRDAAEDIHRHLTAGEG